MPKAEGTQHGRGLATSFGEGWKGSWRVPGGPRGGFWRVPGRIPSAGRVPGGEGSWRILADFLPLGGVLAEGNWLDRKGVGYKQSTPRNSYHSISHRSGANG